MDKETYTMNMHCSNCGANFTLDFSKGSSCEGFFTCPTCGCRNAKAGGLFDEFYWKKRL